MRFKSIHLFKQETISEFSSTFIELGEPYKNTFDKVSLGNTQGTQTSKFL